jgi:integrase
MGPIFMAKRHLRLVTPAIVNRTVKPRRHPNASLRTREYLTEAEVERLMKAARRNRWGHRDATMILVAYRHGLRASELVDLRWEQIEFRAASLHVRRVEQGYAEHPSDPRGRAACFAAASVESHRSPTSRDSTKSYQRRSGPGFLWSGPFVCAGSSADVMGAIGYRA